MVARPAFHHIPDKRCFSQLNMRSASLPADSLALCTQLDAYAYAVLQTGTILGSSLRFQVEKHFVNRQMLDPLEVILLKQFHEIH